jgi:hypothetical protein
MEQRISSISSNDKNKPKSYQKEGCIDKNIDKITPFYGRGVPTFLQGLFHNCLISKQLQNR